MLWLLHVSLIGFNLGPKSGDIDASASTLSDALIGISSRCSVSFFVVFWSSILLWVNSISLICSRIKWNSEIWLTFLPLFYITYMNTVPGTAYSRSGGMDCFAEACDERPIEMSSMNFDFVHILSMSDLPNYRSSCSFNWHVISFHHAYHTWCMLLLNSNSLDKNTLSYDSL